MLDEEVPYLFIVPLVENSIKHGLYEKSIDGYVYISVKKLYGRVYIEVRDNGIGITRDKIKELNRGRYFLE